MLAWLALAVALTSLLVSTWAIAREVGETRDVYQGGDEGTWSQRGSGTGSWKIN